MTQPFGPGNQPKKRTCVLIFLKGTTAPLVLYPENPISLYEEMLSVLKNGQQTPKIIEKTTNGPMKKVAILSTSICAVAIQEETYLQ